MKLVNKISLVLLASSALALPSMSANASHTHRNNHIKIVRMTHNRHAIHLGASSNVNMNQPNNNQNQRKQDPHFKHVFKIAKSKLGDRYRWGATGKNVFDCSGFTQYVYKHGAHKLLPRTAGAQKEYCHHVARKHVQPGDLVFFGANRHSIAHVGLCVGHGKMIDAQNRGVITESIKAPWWHVVGYGRP